MEKRYKAFRFLFILLFVTFLTLYFSQLTGYYEFQNYQKMTMTQEQILQFEQDVKEGKEVDIKDYVVNQERNYKNRFSNLGLQLSKGVSAIIEKSVIKIFSTISGFVSS